MITPGQANGQSYDLSTEELREAYAQYRYFDTVEADEEFDHFMARVRREAKAEALREAADAYSNYEGGDNEHVVRLWLRMRAEESS